MNKLTYDWSLYIVTYRIFTLIIIKSPIALKISDTLKFIKIHQVLSCPNKQGNLG